MADDINLPDLISHLGVDLTGLSGTVADASRQGSSVGAALGGGIQRELRDLLAHLPTIDVDASTDEVDRDLARVREELDGIANQRIGVDISIGDALRRLEELEPHLQRLSDTHPDVNVTASTRAALRQLEELREAARRADDTDVDIDVDVDEDRPRRLVGLLRGIPSVAGSAAGALSGVAKAGAGIGAAVPLVASLVQTLANVAPAAGVAVTGMAALQLATGTVKLAMVGVEDAISAALDPSKAEEFNEALKKLSPEAQQFATAVKDVSPALRDMQQAVQNEVFRGLAENLERTSKSVLPVLRTNLLTSATALGDMAAGALGAGKELADDGTLGKALGSASAGLQDLSGIPGVVVTALGQIGAAAGPSFEQLTSKAAEAAFEIGEKLGDAYESGALQDAIETAVDLLGDLKEVGGNVMEIIGGIFNAVPEGGGGLVGTLKEVTGALADVVNTQGVQDGLRSLFETMGEIGSTVAPLLGQALEAIAPVVTALGPPVQELVGVLGDALSPIIDALAPILKTAAEALGELIIAVSPLLEVFGELITMLLPVLMPLFEALSEIFAELAPVLDEVAQALLGALAPILEQMPGFVQPFADILVELVRTLLPVISDLIIELAPTLASLGEAFGELMAAAAPIMGLFGKLVVVILEALMPIIQPLIGLLAGLVEMLAKTLTWAIEKVVIPVLKFLAKLLSGDFSGAWKMARQAVTDAWKWIKEKAEQIGPAVGAAVVAAINWLKGMPGKAASALASLAGSLKGKATAAGREMVSAISGKVADAVGRVRALPGKAASALSGLGSRLYSAGRSLIQGFINGIVSMFGEVQSKLSGLTNSLTDWKGPPDKDATLLTPAGKLLIDGFIRGIDAQVPGLRSRLQQLTADIPTWVDAAAGVNLSGTVSGALAGVPNAGQLAAVYAGAGGGDQNTTINLYGTEATPDGMLRALSWQGLVGRR
ncbi:phage tail protein [Streptomyces coelicoflavus]|uniref:phage tail protein n=1 Tax=Streptomyces coelicoflavus TaxID=285562 RepID=UPI00362F9EB5